MTRSIFSSTTPLPESKGSCRSSTAPIMKTLSLPFSQPVSPTVATASARISPAKNLQSPKKTCSNTAPTAPTPSTPSTSAARNSPSTTLFRCLQAAFSEVVDKFFQSLLPLFQNNLVTLPLVTAKSENDRLTQKIYGESRQTF